MAPRSLTFTLPHQRATSGGVHVIERLAVELAAAGHRVSAVVRKGPLRPLPGVDVRRDLPEADVLVVGAAQPDAEALLDAPARHGRPIVLLQGYTAPGNPRVAEVLGRRPAVVAVSDWLVDDARARGCRAEWFPVGLDREVFSPGPPAGERGPVVAMLEHRVDWKGTADGAAALARVPGIEVRRFGGDAPLDRLEVAALLREAAVLVCPSWEEGLGLPGIEALACGAALATTDTKGSRDYAIHEQTALVSPPRDPAALAANVIRLLRDPALRQRLADAGQAGVRARYPPWPEAAQAFLQTFAV